MTTLGIAALTVGTAGVSPDPRSPQGPGPAQVRLLTINDLHGHLEPPTGSGGRIVNEAGQTVDAGGAAYLAAHLRRLRDRDTLLVAAGDLIGASPLLSAAYHDEPTVALLGRLGLRTSSAGNHELDEGIAELHRITHGGCHPGDGCSPAGEWTGSAFAFLGANVLEEGSGRHALPPYRIETINGVRVGFIGLVTRTTPDIVAASGIRGLTFTEEVQAAGQVSRELTRRGVKAQIVLLHEGDQTSRNRHPDACPVIPGAGSRIAGALAPEIDLVISGHSHQAYICATKDPAGRDRYYTQGSSFGRMITRIDFQVDRRTGDVIRSSVKADNHVVTRDVAPDPETARLVDTWRDRVSAVAGKRVGTITADIGRAQGPSGESALGNLIADAQLAATGGDADIALMNPGGVRADLTYASSGAEGDGVVTYGEAFTVQPFHNLTQVVTLTGARLKALLERQWTAEYTNVLLPSASLTYTADLTKPVGSRVSDIKINGTPATDAQRIRVAANDFLVGGGNGFTVFTQGTDLRSGPLDIDAFVAYLSAHSPVSPPDTGRITVIT